MSTAITITRPLRCAFDDSCSTDLDSFQIESKRQLQLEPDASEAVGTFTAEDVMRVMNQMGKEVSLEEARLMLDELSTDGQPVSIECFLEFLENNMDIDDGDYVWFLRDAFKAFDEDGDGKITAKEIRHVMKRLGEVVSKEDAEKMIAEADIDGDGALSYIEFVKMMLDNDDDGVKNPFAS